MAGENPTTKFGNEKYYAVKSGRVPGIYLDWPSASAQITGWPKPKQRSFPTRMEAQQWLDADVGSTPAPSESQSLDGNTFFTPNGAEAALHTNMKPSTSKRQKTQPNVKASLQSGNIEYNEEDYEPGFGPFPPGSTDGFDPSIKLNGDNVVYKTEEERHLMKKAPSDADQTKPIRIHTDGSALGNGQNGALAGIGVYFGPGDGR